MLRFLFRCITANQQFLWTMLAAFDEDDDVPAHLLHAGAAGEESKAAHHVITPEAADKVRETKDLGLFPSVWIIDNDFKAQ